MPIDTSAFIIRWPFTDVGDAPAEVFGIVAGDLAGDLTELFLCHTVSDIADLAPYVVASDGAAAFVPLTAEDVYILL